MSPCFLNQDCTQVSREEEVKVYAQTLHTRVLAYPFYGAINSPFVSPATKEIL